VGVRVYAGLHAGLRIVLKDRPKLGSALQARLYCTTRLPEDVADVGQVGRPQLLGYSHQHVPRIITHTLLPISQQVGNALGGCRW